MLLIQRFSPLQLQSTLKIWSGYLSIPGDLVRCCWGVAKCLDQMHNQREGTQMRYVLLIYRSEADSASMTQQELAELMQGHALFAREALARGILTGGEPLQPTSTATTVRVRDGKMLITDGPFAETKEQLAGTYVLNCKDLDEAIAMAARVPDAVYGSIEIRPVMEL